MLAVALLWPLAMPYSEATRNANEVPRLLQSVSLADQGRLSIDAVIAMGVDPGPDIARYAGRTFPNKGPAVSVIGAAVLKLGDLFGVAWTIRSFTWALRLVTSLLPTLVMLGAMVRHYQERYGASVIFVAGLLYAVATPVMSYMRLAYGHTLAGALSMMGVLLILSVRKNERPDLRALLGGALCALAISADYMAVFWGPVIAVGLSYDAVFRGRWRLLALSGAGALLGIMPLGLYHQAAFDSVWATGYHHSATAAFAQKHGQGLLGLTWPSLRTFFRLFLDPGGGVIWWIPLALVAGLGLWREQRSSLSTRFEGRLLLGVFLVGLLVNLGLNFDGGWRVGPRYLVGFLPVLVPGLAFTLARQRGDATKIVVVGTVVMFSLWVNLAAASLWPHFDLSHVRSPVAEVLLPLLEEHHAPYGGARILAPSAPELLYLLAPVGLVWYFFGKVQFAGYRVALAWLAAALLGTVAARGLPQLWGKHPDAARNLDYIRRVWEPRGSTHSQRESGGWSRPLPRIAIPVEAVRYP